MTAHIHVYRLDGGAADSLPEAFYACLPDEEQRRVAALRRAPDRRNRRLAYAALFRLLHRHSGVAPDRIRLARNRWGKPEAVLPEGAATIHANLSHSDGCVLVAIAPCPVGVDVEAVRPLDIAAINRSVFPEDAPAVADTPEVFYPAWTAREAALKALGAGLSVDPAAIRPGPLSPEFQPLAGHPAREAFRGIQVARLDLPPGYAGAVAARHPRPRYVLRHLDGAALSDLSKC